VTLSHGLGTINVCALLWCRDAEPLQVALRRRRTPLPEGEATTAEYGHAPRRCCIITEKLSKISYLHFSLRIQNHRTIRHLLELCNNAHAISKNIPLNMLSKWMGHASLEVTAIYANALGEEQRNIAARM